MDLMVGFGCSNYLSIRQNILSVPKKNMFFGGRTGIDYVGKSLRMMFPRGAISILM